MLPIIARWRCEMVLGPPMPSMRPSRESWLVRLRLGGSRESICVRRREPPASPTALVVFRGTSPDLRFGFLAVGLRLESGSMGVLSTGMISSFGPPA
jgi:hypothetical protein